jgi:hypothetical protein
MASPAGSEQTPSSESPGLYYLGAFVVAALVIGLAFFIRDAPTKWIVVITGVVMAIAVLLAYAKEMAGERRRS